MQGTSLTKQERECKLYDEFDKFTYKKGESLHEYYLSFINTLPDEWSKFVTDVKLVKDLHTTNIDQLHAYLQQHERHANEVRLMHERNSDPLALVASHQLTQPAYQSHLHTHPNSQPQHHVSPYQSSQFVTPYQTQQFTTNQSTPLSITYPSNEYQSSSEFSQPDSGLIVLVFQKGDDLIDAINHMMSFLTAVVISRGDKLLMLLEQRENTLLEQVEATQGNNGLPSVTTSKGRVILPSSALSPREKGMKRAKIALMANLSRNGSDALTETETEITSDSNIIPYSQYLSETQTENATNLMNSSAQQDVLILSIANKALTTDLDRYKEELKKLKERQHAVEQHRLESRTFKVKMNQVLSENERLLAQAIDYDIVKTVVNDGCETVNGVLDQNAPSFTQLFELSELRAQSQEKDTVIVKLKEQIKSLKGNVDDSKVKIDMDEIETLNIELEHRVTKLSGKFSDLNAKLHEQGPYQIVPSGIWTPLQSRISTCKSTGDRSQLTNFISKFLGTVKFGNDQVAKIIGYGDYQIRNVTISRVYYVEGLGHNLFSVGQFCDSNLEVAFRQHTCFIRNLEGVDLLTGSQGDNPLYTSLGK
ncbi:hypothetical protein Tco_0133179 [Tanacetum coccineum]